MGKRKASMNLFNFHCRQSLVNRMPAVWSKRWKLSIDIAANSIPVNGVRFSSIIQQAWDEWVQVTYSYFMPQNKWEIER